MVGRSHKLYEKAALSSPRWKTSFKYWRRLEILTGVIVGVLGETMFKCQKSSWAWKPLKLTTLKHAKREIKTPRKRKQTKQWPNNVWLRTHENFATVMCIYTQRKWAQCVTSLIFKRKKRSRKRFVSPFTKNTIRLQKKHSFTKNTMQHL